jgi:aconitate hydratase
MGVLPCQFTKGVSAQTLALDGSERFDLELDGELRPRQTATLRITRGNGKSESVSVLVRIDTPIEVAYYQSGGILPYVLDQLLADAPGAARGVST